MLAPPKSSKWPPAGYCRRNENNKHMDAIDTRHLDFEIVTPSHGKDAKSVFAGVVFCNSMYFNGKMPILKLGLLGDAKAFRLVQGVILRRITSSITYVRTRVLSGLKQKI